MSASTIKKSHALSELISSVRRVTENTLKWTNVDIKQQSREKKTTSNQTRHLRNVRAIAMQRLFMFYVS